MYRGQCQITYYHAAFNSYHLLEHSYQTPFIKIHGLRAACGRRNCPSKNCIKDIDRYGFRGHNFNVVKIQAMQVTWRWDGTVSREK